MTNEEIVLYGLGGTQSDKEGPIQMTITSFQ